MEHLEAKLKKLEKRNYRSYTSIKGEYDFTDFTLSIDNVQSDPYAPPSRLRAKRAWSLTHLQWLQETSLDYQRAARDFLARHFSQLLEKDTTLSIALSGQTVLDHTSVIFDDEGIELRYNMNLPADGREILAKRAINILTFHMPKYIRRTLLARELPIDELKAHCQVIVDQVALRRQLAEHNLVAFVANGSILPRIAGNNDRPMKDAIPFQSPASLEVELSTPNRGLIKGMGIPKGITLIVGGGFHGKSTLLNALERSIYDHIPGDGREYIVTEESTTKIQAEDGRCVHNLNLSNYINHLPMGKDTTCFSTQDASGSTSQAAWLQESLEAQAKTLLIDEDTSATNFMIRDERMQALVNNGAEPITPLVDRIGQLRDELDVSTILVMGGSGDYLDVADTVIQMHDYQAVDVTVKAKEVVATHPTTRVREGSEHLLPTQTRQLNRSSLQAILQEGKFRIQARNKNTLRFGRELVDITAMSQLQSSAQVHAIGWLWFQLSQTPGWETDPVEFIAQQLHDNWYELMPKHGDLAKPRVIEVMATLNRMRVADFK
ncbi:MULTISPECIES: ABC-ATPase domain-containing protein [Aliivibrio]|uniref:Isopentenyl-diphosphate delta-isomerase n=1 Tax=Aliivibrio finisterrensis TaxID=511998 RepID=A0A4V1Z7Z2_9GAMM|nr:MULTISPECIES: ABC-ATPase domain-containing protein [Aliivibrio]MDD9180705.1 ABC-ATPase domain-containing protein [Aliivibrio sp. A6]RYU47086.1 isopentenyl-diphosphate delta-isomerase [Aliivibrio finisterrensis]RYU47839.1 isopentenyl-diphosphate delta-isomerase [Aliivibrio finisterrensis]RYU52610.1 isopentenyl-diphosphate delta-isomerase [Aliivibrio finisterrensis]RYU59196.1 isopentenyl-diphosphate delta-isomerase [Aliivibrio finisterrensis]